MQGSCFSTSLTPRGALSAERWVPSHAPPAGSRTISAIACASTAASRWTFPSPCRPGATADALPPPTPPTPPAPATPPPFAPQQPQLGKSNAGAGNKGQAVAGLVLGVVGIVIPLLLLAAAVSIGSHAVKQVHQIQSSLSP